MTLAKPRPPLLRSVATALMTTLLAGCLMWEPASLTPQVIVDATRGVRVTLRDGSRVDLRMPYMLSDSLIGGRHEYGRGVRRPFSLNEIALIETAEIDGNATAGVVVGSVYAMVILVSAFMNSGPAGPALISTGRVQADRRDP